MKKLSDLGKERRCMNEIIEKAGEYNLSIDNPKP
jgi:hypothetical protein